MINPRTCNRLIHINIGVHFIVLLRKALAGEDLCQLPDLICLDNTTPDDMEVRVGDEKNDKNDRIDDEKEAACPDDTTPDDMEVGVGDEKNDKNDRFDDEKEPACQDDTTPDDMEVSVGDKKMT